MRKFVTLNLTFTNEDYQKLRDQKDRIILSWEAFILLKCLGKK